MKTNLNIEFEEVSVEKVNQKLAYSNCNCNGGGYRSSLNCNCGTGNCNCSSGGSNCNCGAGNCNCGGVRRKRKNKNRKIWR